MDILRTPDDRFSDLPGYPFAPHYAEALPGFSGLRMHFIDEGPRDAAHVFLCLHGQPTWSYLYRRMVPVFSAAGHRVVAPDFFGFGRSDKPVDEAAYRFDFHRDSIRALIENLDLSHITLVCQDWGGLIGLTIPPAIPHRFDRLLVMNTAFAAGDEPLTDGFIAWRAWSNANPDMAVGRLLRRSCPHLTDAEVAAYDAPFPDQRYKAGVRRFPNMVPDHPDAPGAALSRSARTWWATEWRGESFMAIGGSDPVLGEPVMRRLRESIRGCPAPLILPEAGHFVQEWDDKVAGAALAAFG
jgi:pimeloyl-ACP methyl ester carboxylesterase